MPFLLCNILIAFSLFFDLSSLTFCSTPWLLCLKNPFYAYIYAGCVLNFSRFTSIVGFFSQKRRVVFTKTTACFLQNDVLFSSKRRVVFIKRRLVFFKTTCCFHQNDVLFFCVRSDVKKPLSDTQSISQDFEMKYYRYQPPLAHARVHAHYRSFSLFAVTSVTL